MNGKDKDFLRKLQNNRSFPFPRPLHQLGIIVGFFKGSRADEGNLHLVSVEAQQLNFNAFKLHSLTWQVRRVVLNGKYLNIWDLLVPK